MEWLWALVGSIVTNVTQIQKGIHSAIPAVNFSCENTRKMKAELVSFSLFFWLRKTRLPQFCSPKLINSHPKVILHLLTNTIALYLFVCLYVLISYCCVFFCICFWFLLLLGFVLFLAKNVKPSEVIMVFLPWWINSTIWNAIKPFPPEGGKPCFLLSYMTVLYTLTEFHLSCCLFYLLNHFFRG